MVLSVSSRLPEPACRGIFRWRKIIPIRFNPETTIAFDISGNESADVQLNIFNLRGQLVRKLVSEKLSPGQYEVRWNTQNNSGQPVASGVYLYQLRVGDVIQVRKMQLIR
ncbi:MAG: FlgD immunoglobulin-like domain containing protein [Calditrichia bacterium]